MQQQSKLCVQQPGQHHEIRREALGGGGIDQRLPPFNLNLPDGTDRRNKTFNYIHLQTKKLPVRKFMIHAFDCFVAFAIGLPSVERKCKHVSHAIKSNCSVSNLRFTYRLYICILLYVFFLIYRNPHLLVYQKHKHTTIYWVTITLFFTLFYMVTSASFFLGMSH